MPRFFVNPTQIDGKNITIIGDDAKHIGTVLRMKKDEKITVCNGQSIDYDCIIVEVNKKTVVAEIIDTIENQNEPKVKVVLYQALPKADKLELIIQKCIELGIDEIVPVVSEHTIVKLDIGDKSEKKLERWNKIAESAAKQCMRGKIPCVQMAVSYEEALIQANTYDGAFIAYEKEKVYSIKSFLREFKGKSLAIFIGPEGGFSAKEIQMAIDKNVKTVTLGNRILRTETAGFYTVANIMYELDN